MRVGFIGIGNMGFAMAARLRGQGWPVGVHDIDARRMADAAALGAALYPSPAALAAASDALVVVVVDATQVDRVLFGPAGAAAALRPGAAVLLCPTVGPADVERVAARLQALGIGCIDAPMSGGPVRARDGSMSLMLACDDAVFERCRGLVEALSSKVFRIGMRPGDGARTKLVNNLLAAVNLAGAAEALALAARIGLDPARTLAVIQASSGQSWIGADRLTRALAADPQVGAHLALLAKDSALALAMAHDAAVPLAVGSAAAAVYAGALAAGLGRADDSVLYRRALDASQGLSVSPAPAGAESAP
jgi:putative dehydrogenase